MNLQCSGLAQALDSGHAIVTPSRLFADIAGARFTRDQLTRGKTSWQRPVVLGLYAWLASVWQNARYRDPGLPTLLSPSQERSLWQQLFEEQHPDLFDGHAAASMAIDATRMLAEWHISADRETWDEGKDVIHFRELHRQFRQACRDRDCITRSDLWRYLPAQLQRDPQPVLFAGFDPVSPALQAVIDALGPAAELSPFSTSDEARGAVAISCENLTEEIETAARHARALLEASVDRSIGILVANLREHRPLVTRIFRSVFSPSTAAVGGTAEEPATAYHCPGGEPLLHHPAIATALLLLDAVSGNMSVSDASALFRSPFIKGAAAERSLRARADLYLRKNRKLRVTVSEMTAAAAFCPMLLAALHSIDKLRQEASTTQSVTRWSEWIAALLEGAGWPGDIALSSSEKAIVEAWGDALNQLGTLTYILPSVTYSRALRELRRILLALAAPSSGDWLSPVQILDADEAAGVAFDSAVVVGLSEGTWPGSEKAQPFIPLRLRRAAGVPGSSAADARRAREMRLRLLLSSAAATVVTYTDAISPLAKRLPRQSAAVIPRWAGELPLQSFTAESLERLADETAPPLDFSRAPLGGVSIIKSQSLCPFQAFARYRLLADSPEEPAFGIDARDRGGHLHSALEQVWRRLQSSSALQSIDPDALRALIRESVASAVDQDSPAPFQRLVTESERRRLESVVLEWLQFERSRHQPFEVEFLEEKRTLELAGLPLNLRVDRIDRLANGKVLLIDYKSGAYLSTKDLCGTRPKEPQLLVYAAAAGAEVEGVYLAQVRTREMRAQGMAVSPHFPEARKPKDAPVWQVERSTAVDRLTALASEFVSGHAAVDPQSLDVCTYCPCKLICRIAESGTYSGEAGDD